MKIIEKMSKCFICEKENPKGRNKTCSKKCARKYGYSMNNKKRIILREKIKNLTQKKILAMSEGKK